jgi:hypothetical protein
MDRILPVRKERPITIALPEVSTIEGVVEALGIVTSAVAEGEITPGDAATLAGVLETKRKAIETLEIERRISALEQRSGR